MILSRPVGMLYEKFLRHRDPDFLSLWQRIVQPYFTAFPGLGEIFTGKSCLAGVFLSSFESAPAFTPDSKLRERELMTPVDYSGQEKRITFQLYNYWFGLTRDYGIPSLTTLTPGNIAPYKDNMVLIDLRDPDHEPTLQIVGQLLTRELARDLNLKNITDIPRHTLLSRITGHYKEVIANRSPISFDAEFKNACAEIIRYRAILLPFSDDGEKINFILGAVRWITQADVTTPNIAADNVTADKISYSVLKQRLDACRQLLHQRHPAGIRSRKSLYDSLGIILDFHELCCTSPNSYHDLLLAKGLKTQKRAPFTPTLKLCFGRSYDKTRLTEYATALSYAQKNHVSGSHLANFLNNFPGGIKGCVRAEREEKNISKTTTRQKPKNDLHKIIADLPSLAHFDMPPTYIPHSENNENSNGLCLFLARRDGSHIDVIKIMKKDKKILAAILKQFVKDP